MLFHIVDDCFVIVRKNGVYRQSKLYRRDHDLFAGVGAGFVRLLPRGSTTVPQMSWDFITPHPEIINTHLAISFGRRLKAIEAAE